MYVNECLSVCRHIHEEPLQNSIECRSHGTRLGNADLGNNNELHAGPWVSYLALW